MIGRVIRGTQAADGSLLIRRRGGQSTLFVPFKRDGGEARCLIVPAVGESAQVSPHVLEDYFWDLTGTVAFVPDMFEYTPAQAMPDARALGYHQDAWLLSVPRDENYVWLNLATKALQFDAPACVHFHRWSLMAPAAAGYPAMPVFTVR